MTLLKGYVDTVEAASRLGLSVSDESVMNDLKEALAYAEEAVETYCQMEFVTADNEARTYDGSGTQMLSFGSFIRTLRKVELLNDDGSVSSEISDAVARPNPSVLKDASGNKLKAWIERRSELDIFPTGMANIRVTADWGMAGVPLSIKNAIILTAQHYFNLRNLDETKRLETGLGRTVEFKDKVEVIPNVAKTMLSRFRYRSIFAS